MSDPEVPTLADVAADTAEMMESEAGHIERLGSSIVRPELVAERVARRLRDQADYLRAALGQREPDTPADDSVRTYEQFERRYLPETVAKRERENETAEEAGRRIAGEALAKAAPATPGGGELDDHDAATIAEFGVTQPELDAINDEVQAEAELDDLLAKLDVLRSVPCDTGRIDAICDEIETRLRHWDLLRIALRSTRRELAEVRDTPRGEVLARGIATANPSTLYMNGTSPVVVYVRATADELRALNRTEVVVVRAAEDKETPNG